MNPTNDLNLAVLERNPEGVLSALQAGADPNARYTLHRTPLGILSQDLNLGQFDTDRSSHWLRHAQCVRILVENGASLDVTLFEDDIPENTLRDRMTWYKRGLMDAPVYLEGALEAEMSLMLAKELDKGMGEAPAPRRKRL